MSGLLQVYYLCAGGGFAYLLFSAFLGASDAASDAGDAGGIDAGDVQTAHARIGSAPVRRIDVGLLLLKLSSPYTLASFCFFFGLAGILESHYLPLIGWWQLLPATISGVIGYGAMTTLMNSIATRMYASSSHREVDLIGNTAEITVPISAGRVGEIIYLKGKTRHTATAKAKDPSDSFATTCKVMITDIADGVYVVEHCDDFLLEDSAVFQNQKLRNS